MSKSVRVACKYTGPLADFSGYGEANRNYVSALHKAGVDLTTEIFSYGSNEENYFGESYRLAKSLEGLDIDYDIKIIHVPCDAYIKFLEPLKYHIGHLFWETDRMSPEWVWNCNLMDEIWTGSDHNKRAFEASGVTTPIWVFPQAVDTKLARRKREVWQIPGHKGFLFYSIFQWIERKNPRALVKAYLREFSSEDKVGLLLKTYVEHFTNEERDGILKQIKEWKAEVTKDTGRDRFAPIYVNVELMDKEDVFRIHATGDCFVLPHRGEGWGIPLVESLLFGKPVIATNCGGVHGWLTKETYYALTYKEIDVFGMEFAPWYRTDQKWADVDVKELQQWMRWVCNNHEEAKETGQLGREFVERHLSFESVGEMLKDRLVDIQAMLSKKKMRGKL